jgi:hypothetical protein
VGEQSLGDAEERERPERACLCRLLKAQPRLDPDPPFPAGAGGEGGFPSTAPSVMGLSLPTLLRTCRVISQRRYRLDAWWRWHCREKGCSTK